MAWDDKRTSRFENTAPTLEGFHIFSETRFTGTSRSIGRLRLAPSLCILYRDVRIGVSEGDAWWWGGGTVGEDAGLESWVSRNGDRNKVQVSHMKSPGHDG